MKNTTILTSLLIAAAVLLSYMIFFQADGAENRPLVPCSEPLKLRVNSLDDRFQIDRATLKSALKDVADLWSSAIGYPVVIYSEDAELGVDLVYAEEQQLTDRERQFRDRLQSESISIEVMERRFNERENKYERKVNRYEEEMQKLQESIKSLNRWVDMNNRNGGFSEDQLREYEHRKASVDRKSKELRTMEGELMRDAETVNRMIGDINRQIENKNELVDQYNRTFTGERKFTQGAYEWNHSGESIQVYQFSSVEELKLVLAHEVGHALGLDHVENPTSIMYYLMGNQIMNRLTLTSEDIEALRAICNEVRAGIE